MTYLGLPKLNLPDDGLWILIYDELYVWVGRIGVFELVSGAANVKMCFSFAFAILYRGMVTWRR